MGKRRMLLRAALVLCGLLVGGLAVAISIPYPVAALAADRGAPIVLLDRNGEPLRQVPSPSRPGRERWVSLDEINSHAVQTLLASEDQRFFEHRGIDLIAVARSLLLNIRAGGVRFGASTLTMQLMRMVHSPGEPRTLGNKIKESLLALRVERSLSKQEILEQYLNRVAFGRGAVGIEAAAARYFGKPAAALSIGEATFLMVLPRGPAHYDPLRHRDRVLARRDHLMTLLMNQGRLTPQQVRRALDEPVAPALHPLPFEAPHFTDWVLAALPESVKQHGGTVRTTLDLRLQRALEHRTREHVAALSVKGVSEAGVVVLDAATGDVLAMVGSGGYKEGSQINITTRRRYPGSALKPFVYAAAIEALGHTPATIAYDIADVPSEYRVRGRGTKERGPVRYREALAGSYNLAAVHVLEKVGVAPVQAKLRTAGVGELEGTPEAYGLRLALGSAKVTLLDLAAGYRFLVREGTVVPPRGALSASGPKGETWRTSAPRETRVFTEESSWLVMDMLSDPEARRPMFGYELPADLPYKVVVKTGTARGFADTVAVFATKELIAAAWTGRFDGGPTKGVYGMKGAAPLARAALLLAADGRRLTLPSKPENVVAVPVCPLSGKRPGPACPHRMIDYAVRDRVPRETCDWHYLREGRVAVRYPEEIRGYTERNSRKLALR